MNTKFTTGSALRNNAALPQTVQQDITYLTGALKYAGSAWDGCEWFSCFGCDWWPADKPEPTEEEAEKLERKKAVFPDMTDRQKVTFGKRSGVLVIGG